MGNICVQLDTTQDFLKSEWTFQIRVGVGDSGSGGNLKVTSLGMQVCVKGFVLGAHSFAQINKKKSVSQKSGA